MRRVARTRMNELGLQ